jgi:hypothetical protein
MCLYMCATCFGLYLGHPQNVTVEDIINYNLSCPLWAVTMFMFIFNYALQPLRPVVRSGLDVPTFATRRLHACHHARVPSGTVGEKCPVILPKCQFTRYIWGSFTCRKATTWDRRLYFPSEWRRAEDFFGLKIRRLRPGANPRTWVPKASTLPLDHRSRCVLMMLKYKIWRKTKI